MSANPVSRPCCTDSCSGSNQAESLSPPAASATMSQLHDTIQNSPFSMSRFETGVN